MDDSQLLYLFSSDQTVRYAQDIIDVLGAPSGRRFRFRYNERHVEAEARAHIDEGRLKGARGLVVFASQHPAMYAPAAFVPIRFINVVSTERVGTHLFVEFTVDELVTLPRRVVKERPGQVAAFTRFLADHTNTPYESWASVGTRIAWAQEDAPPVIAGGNEDEYFEIAAEYLAGTAAFANTTFLRFLRCSQVGGHSSQDRLTGDPPALELTAGNTYQLELLQFVPHGGPVEGGFSVLADDSIVLVQGEPRVRVASRYDKPGVRVQAKARAEHGVVETSIVIEPHNETDGPRLEIPIRVSSSLAKSVTKATAITAALSVLALPAILTEASDGLRVGLALAGALAASTIQVFGLTVPKLVSVPKLGGTGSAAPRHAGDGSEAPAGRP
jgi:hypothetical protein